MERPISEEDSANLRRSRQSIIIALSAFEIQISHFSIFHRLAERSGAQGLCTSLNDVNITKTPNKNL